MTSISVSAPGKAVLSGEYAVLRGAPAISVALDRRAIVRLDITDNEYHNVATPGHLDGRWRFTTRDAGEIDWLDEPPGNGLRLVEEAWRVCTPRTRGRFSISVDTRDFFAPESGQKLGLGGSSAAMTALVGALIEPCSLSEEVGMLAATAHKALQDGHGSGVDIATSVHGGVIEFKTDRRDAPLQCAWPAGLRYRFLWSGKSANTASKISQFGSGTQNEKGWVSLSVAAEDAASAWKRGSTTEILAVFDRYTDILRQFSIEYDLGIFDAGHDDMKDMAASFGVVYKPCGAGGGDIGIVLAADEAAIDRFCEHTRRLGFSQLEATLDLCGVSSSAGDEC